MLAIGEVIRQLMGPTTGVVLGMALGGSCKFRTTPFIWCMRKYSAVKNLIMKYFRYSHSSRVQPSELVQGGFEVDVNITMYVKLSKPSQSGVGHCQFKWSLAPF